MIIGLPIEISGMIGTYDGTNCGAFMNWPLPVARKNTSMLLRFYEKRFGVSR